MADHVQSVSNTLNVFGPAPSFWGDMVWGVDNWGDGTQDLWVDVLKLIENSQSLSDSLSKEPNHQITNNLTLTSETTEEGLQDGSGYNYIFTYPVTDPEDRSTAAYASTSSPGTTYTSGTAAGTSWS